MTGKEAEAYLDRLASELTEHFDAAQIMVTWQEDGKTFCSKRGAGNYYARIGMARELLDQDTASENAIQIASRLEPPPDDAEAWKKP